MTLNDIRKLAEEALAAERDTGPDETELLDGCQASEPHLARDRLAHSVPS